MLSSASLVGAIAGILAVAAVAAHTVIDATFHLFGGWARLRPRVKPSFSLTSLPTPSVGNVT